MKNDFSIYQMALRTMTSEGTLSAATEMLPFIKENGFDVVYICPVFSEDDDPDRSTWSERQKKSFCDNPKNPYKIKDYYNVDPEFGSLSDLKAFIDKAHSVGLRVWLDLVYLHCGANAVFAKDHPDWLVCDEYGKTVVAETWPFARINYKNPEVREYLWKNMEFYVEKFSVDGFRCDVGDAVPLDFWREGKRRVSKINPDIIMLNEGHRNDYLEVFDLNYWIYDFGELLESENPSQYINERMRQTKKDGSFGRYISHIETHDTATDCVRFDKRFAIDAANAAYFMMYTNENLPMVWNGCEIADRSENNMFSNRFFGKRSTVDWSNAFRADGKKRLSLVRKLNELRKTTPSLCGDIRYLETDGKIVAFLRTDGNETTLFAVNFGNSEAKLSYPGADENKECLISENAEIGNGEITLSAYGFVGMKL